MNNSTTAPQPSGKTDDRESFRQLVGQREQAYSFLASAFFAPPSAEMMQMFADECLHAIFGLEAGSGSGELRELLVGDGEQSAEEPPEVAVARQEFMQLFKVPGGKYVTPYESVFRDACDVDGKKIKGLLMGQSAMDVKQWYRLAALDISGDYADMPDHIALEFSYLAHLCAREREFADAGNEQKLARALEMERDFLAAHVVSWIDQLRDKILEKTQHPYFRSMAVLAAEFTHRDLEALEKLLGASNGSSVPDYKEMEPQSVKR